MWHTLTSQEVADKLNTNIEKGLDNEEVLRRREKYGLNKLDDVKKENFIKKFIMQFNDFMIITLLVAAIISAVLSYIKKDNDYIDSVIIISIVVFNSLMGVIQEEKAEKSLDSLKEMTSPVAKVIRNGIHEVVPVAEVVIGDIITLEAGNYVPADVRLINSFNLKSEESSLTGETESIEKDAKIVLKNDVPIGDMKNMAFAGSIITSGHADAVVTEVGMSTKVGKIAKMLINKESEETPLQRRLRRSRQKTRVCCFRYMFYYFYNWHYKENRTF